MAIATDLQYATVDELFLDPKNPRLGRANLSTEPLDQGSVLDIMKDWTLDELATSYIESGGFWTHEAVLVVEEELYGSNKKVVVEGNRRLAALKLLRQAYEDRNSVPPKWRSIADSGTPTPHLFERVPYIRVDRREEIEAFLGFRHVTGIKEWHPAEKAAFIAHLIDERGFTYEQVMRKIGSKTPAVRQNYIAHRLLLEIERRVEEVRSEDFEDRFSVMYLSLRTKGVQVYLKIDVQAEPPQARKPVPDDRDPELRNYASWLFGTEDRPPLFTDSRLIDKFGKILESPEAVAYLERTERPKFDVAHEIAGGDEPEIVDLLESAADNVELSLTRVHHYKESVAIQKAVERLAADVRQLLSIFPNIAERVHSDGEKAVK